MELLNAQQESERENSRPKRKEISENVRVWDYFTPFTPGMINHVRVCKKNPDNQTLRSVCGSFSVTGGFKEEEEEEDDHSDWEFDEEAVRKSLVRMVVIDQLPFTFVDGEGFKRFIAAACPQFVIPSRMDVAKECYLLYVDEKNKLKTYFRTSGQRVSLSIDTWVCSRGLTYLCLTGHYIDDSWKLHKKMLNFIPCCFRDGDEVGALIEKCLLDWGIEEIFTIIADNASSGDTIAYLRSKFVDWGTALLNVKFLHTKSVAHIVNVVVKDELNELNESIERIRVMVSYVRQSPTGLKRFKEFLEEDKVESTKSLRLDVPTRWDSTYKMLARAVDFKDVFDRFEVYDVDFLKDFMQGGPYENISWPTKQDWISVERFVKVLHYFYELILRVSRPSTLTSNTFFDEIFDLDNLFKNWLTSDDNELVDMATKMKFKFDEYWGSIENTNMMPYIAVMLDPRFKFIYIEYILKDIYGLERGDQMANVAKNAFFDVFKEYENLYDMAATSSHSSRMHEESTIKSECGDNFGSSLKNISDRKKKHQEMVYEMGRANQSELDMYLLERNEKDSLNFDVVDWWKMNSRRFPILSRLARDVLAMPISIVNWESVFSTETPIIDDFRSSLTYRFTQALVCCQDWIRGASVEPDEGDYEEF